MSSWAGISRTAGVYTVAFCRTTFNNVSTSPPYISFQPTRIELWSSKSMALKILWRPPKARVGPRCWNKYVYSSGHQVCTDAAFQMFAEKKRRQSTLSARSSVVHNKRNSVLDTGYPPTTEREHGAFKGRDWHFKGYVPFFLFFFFFFWNSLPPVLIHVIAPSRS